MTKELLEKIKAVTAEILFSKAPADFKSEKLKDSDLEIKYSSLEVGAEVSKASANGDEPLEDGDYTLDSGISFTVKDSKIEKIIEAPAEDEVKVEEDLAEVEKEVPAKDQTELLEKIASIEAQITAITAELEKTKETQFAKQTDVTALAEVLNAIAKTPFEFSKTDNRVEMTDSKNDRLKALADIISLKK